jgi:transposase
MKSQTVPLFCNTHALRNFKEQTLENFPKPSQFVLHVLGLVYQHEEICQQLGFNDEERLFFHQQTSGPLMESLNHWMKRQLETKKVEPNSALGKAMNYMLKRWKGLTGFLRIPGAPLDSNKVERALKIMIRHRTASFFFKTVESARLASSFVSLVQTCIEAGKNPLDYLVKLQEHFHEVSLNPEAWLPWNYEATLETG